MKLYLGDCISVMGNKVKDESVDLTVTSPPYDNLREYNGDVVWNEEIWKQVLDNLYRVTKPGGTVVWIVSDAYMDGTESGTSFRQALYAKEIGFRLNDTMIWNKMSFAQVGNIGVRYPQVFEYMFVFTKGKPKTFNGIKDRINKNPGKVESGRTRFADGSLKYTTSAKNKVRRKAIGYRFNIWGIHPTKSTLSEHHPAPFPKQLASDHIITWSNPGDTILDPFMGSGTTGVACIENDRKFIGIELNEKYFKFAKKRIKSAIGPLF